VRALFRALTSRAAMKRSLPSRASGDREPAGPTDWSFRRALRSGLGEVVDLEAVAAGDEGQFADRAGGGAGDARHHKHQVTRADLNRGVSTGG
jgi:hypothetical protein